jgi:hypothetical protein
MSARGITATVVALTLVVGAAVVVDRVAAGTARDLATEQLRANVPDLVGTPRVEVLGFPFLTQLVGGRLTEVRAHLDGAGLGGVKASDVDIDARGVSTQSPYVVQHALVRATLSPATVRALVAARTGLDLDLRTDGDTLIGTVGVLGLPVSATLRPQVTDGQIHLTLVALTLAGVAVPASSLPAGLATVLGALVIPVDGLPAGVTVTDTAVVAGGVRATLTGTGVALTELVGRSAG